MNADKSAQTIKNIIGIQNNLRSIYDHSLSEAEWQIPNETFLMVEPFLRPGLKYLEIGIGKTDLAEKIAEAGCFVTGIAVSAVALADYKEEHPVFELILDDIETGLQNLKQREFELIAATTALESVSDLDDALSLLQEQLAPNGLLCFSDVRTRVEIEQSLKRQGFKLLEEKVLFSDSESESKHQRRIILAASLA
ncbi:MAG: methyltransferase domain-containing protein [Deltaproteobacteria bacterium]|nr:methyltransferase domain-containing protein [Deltaproteobacteria bacterium]